MLIAGGPSLRELAAVLLERQRAERAVTVEAR
jgi:hypothetical protein